MAINHKILPCHCEHPYQDQLYGRGMRVHTRTKKESGGRNEAKLVEWRCTVCRKTQTSKDAVAEAA